MSENEHIGKSCKELEIGDSRNLASSVAHDHASRTHGKVVICKNHTQVSTPTFVFGGMNKVLLETMLQNLNEMVRFDFLLCGYHICYVQVFQVKQQNHKSHPTFVTEKSRSEYAISFPE